MSLINPRNKKGTKQENKKPKKFGPESKFIQKPGKPIGFVKKQANTGSQRGS